MSSSDRGELGDVARDARSEGVGGSAVRRWSLLGFALLGVLLVWGAILPWIAGQPVMRATWERWHQQGVDPSVRFYTELPVSDPVARRLEGR